MATRKKAESKRKQADNSNILELKAKLEKELVALLAHPSVPKAFKKVFEDME